MVRTKSAASHLFLDPQTYRVGVLDIESTGLTGGYHIVLCCVIKIYGTTEERIFRVNIHQIDLFKEEERVLNEINDFLAGLDGIITYYGTRFDAPMLRTRMMFHGINPFDKIKHLDMYYTVRRIVNLERKRMWNVVHMMRATRPELESKTALNTEVWMGAIHSRNAKDMDYIVDHCILDVRVLENIVEQFYKFIPDRITRK